MDLGLAGKVIDSGGKAAGLVADMTLKEDAVLAVFLCSERAAFLTGETIRIDGGYTKSLFQAVAAAGRHRAPCRPSDSGVK